MSSEDLNVAEKLDREQWQSKIDAALGELSIKGDFRELPVNRFGLTIVPKEWLKTAEVLSKLNARFSAIWVDEYDKYGTIFCLFYVEQYYCLVQTKVEVPELHLDSIASVFPAADRMERHIQDMIGIYFDGHPDNRRWTRHLAWHKKDFPLRYSYPLKPQNQQATRGDTLYPFFQTQGSGVYEIPVGPIHAGIIEPGHFRFQAVGERILNLEERFGYTHKGIEKLAVGKTPQQLIKLASRVSGDSAVTHSWAAAKALEEILSIKVPERALLIRAILSERERIANHLGDIGGICNDVGFAFGHHQCARLREIWQRHQATYFGHRLLMDVICLGGVSSDINASQAQKMQQELNQLKNDFSEFIEIIQDYPSLEDRLANTGYLPKITAQQLGCLGYVGKGSGYFVDVRIESPYPPYNLFKPSKTIHSTGDVLSRMQSRIDEVRASIQLIGTLLDNLPDDQSIVAEHETLELTLSEPVEKNQSLAVIEGWRGETLCFIRLDQQGKVMRYFPRDPSWLNWPALEALIDNNIVADFPVCNKSINGSYSGVDL